MKLKKVCLLIVLTALFLSSMYYIIFLAPDEVKRDFFDKALVSMEYPIVTSICIGILLSALVFIYMIELLLYKIKNVLIIDDHGITYFAPEYKRVFIPKEKIKDIYINNEKQLKIILKNYEIKKGIRARFWTMLKDIFLGRNPKNVYRINLDFIDCDAKDVKKALIQFGLKNGSIQANEIVNNKLQKYNCKEIEELKNNETALKECVVALYETEEFTQADISAIVGIDVNKVSKIIRKSLN